MGASNVRWVRLGDYIEQFRHKCANNDAIVSGVDINKQFIPTRANLEGIDISGYYLVPPTFFACNLMHIGRDERLPIAYNNTSTNLVVTSAYYVFHVKKDKCDEILNEYLYIIFCNKEIDRLTWFYTDSSIRGNLRENRFLDIEIPLPSPDEQQKVVNVWRVFREIKEQNEAKAAPLMQVCQSYIQELKHKYPMQEIGPYIEECNERNLEGKFAEQDVRGIATSKGLIETKANLDGVSLNSYKLVKSKEIAFVPDTSRRGDKMSLGLNDSDKTYIVSSISSVFNVDEKNILPNFLYLWFCRSEFDRYARFNSWGSAREAFSFADMKRCKIPLPPIDVQRAIVNIYKCANEAKQIAEEADRLSCEVCPVLLQHVIHS